MTEGCFVVARHFRHLLQRDSCPFHPIAPTHTLNPPFLQMAWAQKRVVQFHCTRPQSHSFRQAPISLAHYKQTAPKAFWRAISTHLRAYLVRRQGWSIRLIGFIIPACDNGKPSGRAAYFTVARWLTLIWAREQVICRNSDCNLAVCRALGQFEFIRINSISALVA